MKLKERFIYTIFRVNSENYCDDKNPESILVYSNYNLKRIREIAKNNLRTDHKIYAIQIKTINTGKIHVIV